jgi:hypothetical protein
MLIVVNEWFAEKPQQALGLIEKAKRKSDKIIIRWQSPLKEKLDN